MEGLNLEPGNHCYLWKPTFIQGKEQLLSRLWESSDLFLKLLARFYRVANFNLSFFDRRIKVLAIN